MGYPVHSYGSDQVLNAWRNTQQNKQMRDDSITQAILQGVSTGAVEAPEGSPVYKGLSKRFGPQFVKGVSEKGAQIRQNQQLEYAVNNFNLGTKYLETMLKLQNQMGTEKANAMVKDWTPKINELYENAGLGNPGISELLTAEQNREKVRNHSLAKVKELTEILAKNPTRANLNQVRMAQSAIMGQKGIANGTVKDTFELNDKFIDGVEKQLLTKEKQQKEIQLEGMRQKNRLALAEKRADLSQGGKPEFYDESLSNAFEAVGEGADPEEVFKKMATQFPSQAKELKSVILDSQSLSPEARKDVSEAVERIVSKKADKNAEYSRIAAKHPRYQKTIRGILLTPASDETMQALIQGLFNK